MGICYAIPASSETDEMASATDVSAESADVQHENEETND